MHPVHMVSLFKLQRWPAELTLQSFETKVAFSAFFKIYLFIRFIKASMPGEISILPCYAGEKRRSVTTVFF
jgi:hypothetical protein